MTSAATLSIFRHMFASVAEEMGVTLSRTAYSPNIKERLDYSCALFMVEGGKPQMLAQADFAVRSDSGGSQPPGAEGPLFFVASRAHHADVGGMSPGSMPLSSEIYQEGIIIPPLKIVEAGIRNEALWQLILHNVRTPQEREGDLSAQLAAHKIGARRLVEIIDRYGLEEVSHHASSLIAYAERLTRKAIELIPDGRYTFQDVMDDDGQSTTDIPIKTTITIAGDQMLVDFAGTAPAVAGNINAVPAITHSAVVYCAVRSWPCWISTCR